MINYLDTSKSCQNMQCKVDQSRYPWALTVTFDILHYGDDLHIN